MVQDVEPDEVLGLARLEGVWHLATAAEMWAHEPPPAGEGEQRVPHVRLYPITGGPPTYSFEVSAADPLFVGTDTGVPWLMYAEGPTVRAQRPGQPSRAYGGVPTEANLLFSGWSDVLSQPGFPEGVLAWRTGAESPDDGPGSCWMVGIGGKQSPFFRAMDTADSTHRMAG